MKNSKGLGRGLEAIFEIEQVDLPGKNRKHALMDEVELSKITPNPNQPRTMFNDEALEELADSIRTLGVIQPLTVKKEADGTYFIISGERRFRAAKLAGLTSVPVYVREVDDQTLLEMALVENIQRQDLNAVDIALSLQRLVDECGLTQEALADRVGKKRSTVANYLRLLNLPAKIQLAVREELISMGHARALVAVESEADQFALLKKVIKNHLSVRQTEELVQRLSEPAGVKKPKRSDEEFPEIYTRLVEQLERLFTPDITIRKGADGGGKIVIGFRSDEEIQAFFDKMDRL
ncbi:MAG: ParB/RepB/Spo0J family partition protein [Rikenellaceae bacterium]|jgi:ParB family chromosome partitioning protein|nr:ParB/RepB/Spo0J family partition protein [Rikenellaceae bacterium]